MAGRTGPPRPVLLRPLGRAATGQPAERMLLLSPERAASWASAQRPNLQDRRTQLELIEAWPPEEGPQLVVLRDQPLLLDGLAAPAQELDRLWGGDELAYTGRIAVNHK